MALQVNDIQACPVHLHRVVNAGIEKVFNRLLGDGYSFFTEIIKSHSHAYDVELAQPWSNGSNTAVGDVEIATGMSRVLKWTVPINSHLSPSKFSRNVQHGKVLSKEAGSWTSPISIDFNTESLDIPASENFRTIAKLLLIPQGEQTHVYVGCNVDWIKEVGWKLMFLKPIINSESRHRMQGLWQDLLDHLVKEFSP